MITIEIGDKLYNVKEAKLKKKDQKVYLELKNFRKMKECYFIQMILILVFG